MLIMLDILLHNIFPIFILCGLGFLLARNFSLDIVTLNKINFYLLVPSFTFVYLYSTNIPFDMLKVLAASVILFVLSYAAAYFVSKLMGYSSSMRNAFVNSVIFYNSGNIGVPLITLVFSSAPFIAGDKNPYLSLALTVQILVLVTQDITTNTIGFFNAGRAHLKWKDSIKKILTLPAIYAIPSAFILKFLPIDLTITPFWPALVYMKNALVPVALIILGVQISKTRIQSINLSVLSSVLLRLAGGPLLAFGIISLLSLDGVVAQSFLISSAVPTAVNTALIAVEYDNQPEFASQAVWISTLACTLTLLVVIHFARILFPV